MLDFGGLGLLLNIPFLNLTTSGCDPTGFSLMVMKVDRALRVEFTQL